MKHKWKYDQEQTIALIKDLVKDNKDSVDILLALQDPTFILNTCFLLDKYTLTEIIIALCKEVECLHMNGNVAAVPVPVMSSPQL